MSYTQDINYGTCAFNWVTWVLLTITPVSGLANNTTLGLTILAITRGFDHLNKNLLLPLWLWNVVRSLSSFIIQDGAEPTDTFQMVIDSIWKLGKISETVYKYVQVCYLLPTDYKLIFWKLHQSDGLRLHQCIVASLSGSCRTHTSVGPHQ